ncbi:hypothetical protein [Mucilaginibacter terrae]|uniref:HNH endonuclease n=1 Tax=Mucilaginibacter terrae TaxID=1955052 RepID=A0ABU3GNA8_9SPHI|nr:hypothetical protein [Mucilaginibacter terrae]MDT3401251.1 hypothetical protein [Mucilaginibacter terrae]
MIKLTIAEPDNFRNDYMAAVENLILKELKILRRSVDHARGNGLDDLSDIRSFQFTTRDVIAIICDQEKNKDDFLKKNYETTLNTFRQGAIITPHDLSPIYDLIDALIDPATSKLRELLLCEPSELENKSDELYNEFGITTVEEKKIIKIVFNYKTQTDITNAIKGFFQIKNIAPFCPYCNFHKTRYIRGTHGRGAEGFQLDHFFDKATHPLISFSVFNLVPCDWPCNGTNKLSTDFSDEYHLNPYTDGFNQTMVFKAKIDPTELTVSKILFKINENFPSDRYKQLTGNDPSVDVDTLHGNLNVFQFNSRYNDVDILERAGYVIENLNHTINNHRIFKEVLGDTADSYTNYKNWYQRNTAGRFDPLEFIHLPLSKLWRDLHDDIYLKKATELPEGAKDIINRHYTVIP